MAICVNSPRDTGTIAANMLDSPQLYLEISIEAMVYRYNSSLSDAESLTVADHFLVFIHPGVTFVQCVVFLWCKARLLAA